VAPPKGSRIADPPHEGDLAREGDLFEHPLEGQQEGIRRLTVEVGRGGAWGRGKKRRLPGGGGAHCCRHPRGEVVDTRGVRGVVLAVVIRCA
jgi:hypothetical protein